MEFYSQGTDVIIKGTNIKAKTKGVCARGNNNTMVEYDIVYWMNGKRETAWVHEFEIDLAPITKTAGFVNYPENDTPLLKKPNA